MYSSRGQQDRKTKHLVSSWRYPTVPLYPQPHNLLQCGFKSAPLHRSDTFLFSATPFKAVNEVDSLLFPFKQRPGSGGHCLCHHLLSISIQLIRHLAYLFLSTLLLYVLRRLKTLRPYQLGVVGGDLDGRLLVSRCSDESDLRSSGFQTMPPTTRWHTGPLIVQKGELGYMRTFMLSTMCRHWLTSQFYCSQSRGAALSAFCTTAPCCCCTWGRERFGWSWKRSDGRRRISKGSCRSLGRAALERPHNPGSPPAVGRMQRSFKMLLLSPGPACLIKELRSIYLQQQKNTLFIQIRKWLLCFMKCSAVITNYGPCTHMHVYELEWKKTQKLQSTGPFF